MHDFPNRRRLYLMRHGEVSYFEQGRPAPPEGVHLNEQGRAQAAAAALALADISFDRAVTSGLPRTDQTAARPRAAGLPRADRRHFLERDVAGRARRGQSRDSGRRDRA